MASHLMLFAVGPVQDFIAMARRSRDLAFGSYFLSEIAKTVARTIADKYGLEALIFPLPPNLSDLGRNSRYQVVNKILARISDKPADLATDVREAIRAEVERLSHLAMEALKDHPAEQETARLQVADLPELYWVSLPLTDGASGDGSYASTRSMLEALMAARKATRTFDRVQWGAPVPKSSLDGQRESVIPENLYEQVKSRPEQEAWFRHRYGARPAERLCGVSLMKRLGKLPPQFEVYSTSHVAALPLLLTIPSAHQNDLDAYIERLLSLSFDSEGLYGSKKTTNSIFFHSKDEAKRPVDGHILFAERLSDYLNSSASRDENKNRLRAAETALTRFLNAATGGERPLPYYAILLADGDRMGEAIDRLTTIEEHQAISKALSSFAKDADVIVTSHYGSLIYAGGDDVLALVPLHTVLQCARSLADAFFQALEPFGGEVQPANTPTSVDQQTNEPKSHPSPSADSKVASESTKPATAAKSSPTLSVGIVVAHHIEPLEDALAGARAAEREAKSVQGKNALAVTVMKRSGSDTTVAGRWSAPTGEIAGGSINSPKTGKSAESIKVSLGAGGMDRRLTWIIDLHCQDRIPDGAAFDLRDLALRLPFSGENSETIRVARRLEAVRILKRKKMEEPLLKELLQVMSEDDVEMETLAMEMIVARIFADAKTQATAHPHPSAPQPA